MLSGFQTPWFSYNVTVMRSESKDDLFPFVLISCHYIDVIMGTIGSYITSLPIVYSTFYPGPDQRKHQSSASLTFVRGIHQWPVNSPHKGQVTQKMLPFDDVIMCKCLSECDMYSHNTVMELKLTQCALMTPHSDIRPCSTLIHVMSCCLMVPSH